MSQRKKNKKKKLQYGGMEDPTVAPSVGSTALSMGLQGAAAGSAFGPIGTAIGGLGGAAYGLIKGKQMKQDAAEALAEQMRQKQVVTQQNLISNSKTPLALNKGGKLNSKKLKVLNGGSLNPVSPDAVEVNANNPGATDSVELQNAFVDNNEIIDRKDRVFSDDLIGPNGKSIAKSAKRLEKMKSTSTRFNNSNARIDSQLDELFNYQETMKQDATMMVTNPKAFDPIDTLQEEVDAKKKIRSLEPHMGMKKESFDSRLKKLGYKNGGFVKPKPAYDRGGPLSHSTDPNIPEDGFAGITQPAGSQFNQFLTNTNWGKVANTAATVAPNIANAFLQRKLKGPAAPKAPTLENDLTLARVDPSAELAEAKRAANMTNASIMRNTAQGSNLTSSLGSVLAKRLSANNQIYGQNQAINAQIQNQEATLNQFTRARNTDRTNRFKDQEVAFQNDKNAFKNRKLMMTSENIANLSGKIQSQRRERNLMNLDKDKFSIIQARFEDLPAEMRAKYPSVFDYYNSPEYKENNALGGYLSRGSRKRNKNSKSRMIC